MLLGNVVLRSLQRCELKMFRQCSAMPKRKQDVFFDSEVQSILKSLTGRNDDRIFRTRRLGRRVSKKSDFQFVTTEELQDLQKEAGRKAEEKLQMPPVMDERNPQGRVLEEDPLLVGLDVSKFVFTDITFGISDRERLIVVRDTDGTLRTADWEEQDRINQVYYPREGRKHYVPAMFEPEQLEVLMSGGKYEYILDRNCLQFEPDHPLYIRTSEIVYNHINKNNNFDALHSTRHFGPMVFYLCWSKQIDEFIVHQILHRNLGGAAHAVKLYTIINQDKSIVLSEDDLKTVENFANSGAARRQGKIKMALDKIK